MTGYWHITKECEGETIFIVCGGASVLAYDPELLRGKKIIVINTSYERFPFANYLIYADSRWYDHHRKKLDCFKGKIVCASSTCRDPRLLRLRRKQTPGLATDCSTVTINFTTTTAALNLAYHLGAKKIVLFGADGKIANDGRTHHHAPHPWKHVAGCWDKQRRDLEPVTRDLTKFGIECVNTNPDNAWHLWPFVKFEDCLDLQPVLQVA